MADQKAAQTPVGGVEGKTVTDNPATIESANLTDHAEARITDSNWYKSIMDAKSAADLDRCESEAADGLYKIFWWAVEKSRKEKIPVAIKSLAELIQRYATNLSGRISYLDGGDCDKLSNTMLRIWMDATEILENMLSAIGRGNAEVRGGIILGETNTAVRAACDFLLGKHPMK